MPSKTKKYYYVDIELTTKKIVGWGESSTATLTGKTADANVHRMFLPKGQYNKLVKYFD